MATNVIKLCFFDDPEEEENSEEEGESSEEEEKEEKKEKVGQKTAAKTLGNGKDGSVECGIGGQTSALSQKTTQHNENDEKDPSVNPECNSSSKRQSPSVADTSIPPAKKKARLPLPSAFFSEPGSKLPSPFFSSATAKVSSSLASSSTADGRIRTFAHVRGNWASHVFLKPFADDEEATSELGEKLVRAAEDVFQDEVMPSIKVSPRFGKLLYYLVDCWCFPPSLSSLRCLFQRGIWPLIKYVVFFGDCVLSFHP